MNLNTRRQRLTGSQVNRLAGKRTVNRLTHIPAYLLLLFIPSLLMALPDEKNQPASVAADSATINRESGIGTYVGHVVIIRGTTKVTADKVVTYSDKQQHIIEAVAIGKPAHYQTLPQADGKIFFASANRIEYYPPSQKVVLIGNAELKQGPNFLQGQHIIYDQQHGVLQSMPIKNGRTTIVLQPNDLPKGDGPIKKNS